MVWCVPPSPSELMIPVTHDASKAHFAVLAAAQARGSRALLASRNTAGVSRLIEPPMRFGEGASNGVRAALFVASPAGEAVASAIHAAILLTRRYAQSHSRLFTSASTTAIPIIVTPWPSEQGA